MDCRFDDIRDDDKRQRIDARNDDIREEYQIKLEFFQRKNSSNEFNLEVMSLDKELFEKGIHPDLERITMEDKEKHIDKNYQEKLSSIQNQIIEGRTLEELSREYEYTYISALREMKVERPSGQITSLETELLKNYISIDSYEFIDTRTHQNIDMNLSVKDIIGNDAKLSKPTKEEYINRHCSILNCLKDNYERDFRTSRPVIIERDKGEKLSDSLQRMYDEKNVHNPTLQRGIDGLRQVEGGNFSLSSIDYYSRTALSSFIHTFTPEEKMALIPKDSEDQRKITENMYLYPGYMDYIARPLYGYMNANQELMDKIADYFKDNNCRVIETFSGNGLFSRMLQDRGVDIIATEKYDPKDNPYDSIKNQETFTDIIRMDAVDAAREYSDRDIILMSWAPYGEKAASDALLEFAKNNPNGKAFVLTEPYDGCTMDDRSFRISKEIYDDRIDEINNLHVQFEGIHDEFSLWDISPNYEQEWYKYDDY